MQLDYATGWQAEAGDASSEKALETQIMMGVPIKGLICFCLEWQDAKWAVHAQNDMTAILEKKKKKAKFPVWS